MVECLCENHKKRLLKVFDWVLIMPLVEVFYNTKCLQNVNICLILSESASEICH